MSTPQNSIVDTQHVLLTPYLYVMPPPKLCSLFFPPAATLPSVTPVSNAQAPMSFFVAGASGPMLKSKMSRGSPIVVHAFGISTIYFDVLVVSTTFPAIAVKVREHSPQRYAPESARTT